MVSRAKLLVLMLVLLASAIAFGQATSGDIIGTVLDKSGAAVAGATVTTVNQETGVKTTATSNNAGEYRFGNLPIGKYTITASAKGFATSSIKDVVLSLNATLPVKFALAVASVSTQVEVTEAAAAIDTATAQLQSSYDSKLVQDLPTTSVGSGVLNLALLQAGVATANGMGAGSGPSVGGQRPRNNNFTVEGIDNNDKGVTGPLIYVPNDAVAEFTVLQNQFSPEFGHSTGGQFNSVVLNGTNAFHGRVYEYFRNRNLNAMDRQDKIAGKTETPRYDNNRYGGQVGGPIIKNKLFFFTNYEYHTIGTAGTSSGAVCAPTNAGYGTLLALSGGSSANINGLKSFALAPTADSLRGTKQGACQAIKAGNGQDVEVGILPITPTAYTNTKALTTSVDYNISEKDQFRARYIWNKIATLDNAPTLPQFYTTLLLPYDLATVSEYHSFSSNVNNELRLGYNRYGYNYTVPSGSLGKYLGLDAFPNITIDELGLNVGPDPNAPQYSMQNTYQATDNLTWVKGNHTLKFGLEGRKAISPQMFIQRSRGDYDWTTLEGYALDQVPDNIAERSLGNAGYSGDQWAIYSYANDQWKYNEHLTFNLGLRYEYTKVPYGWTNQKMNSVADVPGLIQFKSPEFPKTNFMPRIGFAYSPGKSGNTSIRGGFGMGYDVLYDNIGLLAQPPEVGATTVDCPGPGCTAPAVGFLAAGGIKPFAGSGTTTLDQATARSNTSSYLPNNVDLPYSIQWNLGIQQVFAKDYTFEARYVGTRGVHLDVQNRINIQDKVTSSRYLPTYTANPGQAALDALSLDLGMMTGYKYGCDANGKNCTVKGGGISNMVPAYENAGFGGAIVGYMPYGSSIYHGLQTQLNRRFSNGLQYQVAYTWSHAIDNSTADFFSTIFTPRRQEDFQNIAKDRSNSALDRRHRLTISAMYDVPWFKKSNNWLLKNVLGNYQFSPIYTFESGEWADVQSGVDSNLNGDSAGDRAIINSKGVAGTGSGVTPLYATNNCSTYSTDNGDQATCFSRYTVGYLVKNPNAQYWVAGPGALSNGGRNTLRMRPIENFDMSLLKRFAITERYTFEFALQALNVFNHHQYIGNSINDVAAFSLTSDQMTTIRSNYLVPKSSTFNKPEASLGSNPRQLILNAKFIF